MAVKHPSILITLFCSGCDLLEEGRRSWEAKGRQQGRQGVLVPPQGRQGNSTCTTSLPPPHHMDSQPEPGTPGKRTEHREKKDTLRQQKQLAQRHGQHNQSSGISPTMRCAVTTATVSLGAGKR